MPINLLQCNSAHPEIYASRAKQKTNKVIHKFFVNKTLQTASKPILPSHQVQTSYSPDIHINRRNFKSWEETHKSTVSPFLEDIFGAAHCSWICQTMKISRRNAKILGARSSSLIKKPKLFSRYVLCQAKEWGSRRHVRSAIYQIKA